MTNEQYPPIINGDGLVLDPLTNDLMEMLKDDAGAILAADSYDVAPDALCGWRDCDICGFTFRKSELITLADGSMVCIRDRDEEGK
jgi:hypothetical protein